MRRSLQHDKAITEQVSPFSTFARSLREAAFDFAIGLVLSLVFSLFALIANAVATQVAADVFSSVLGAAMVFVITLHDRAPAFQTFRAMGFSFSICLTAALAMAEDDTAWILLVSIAGMFFFSNFVAYAFPDF